MASNCPLCAHTLPERGKNESKHHSLTSSQIKPKQTHRSVKQKIVLAIHLTKYMAQGACLGCQAYTLWDECDFGSRRQATFCNHGPMPLLNCLIPLLANLQLIFINPAAVGLEPTKEANGSAHASKLWDSFFKKRNIKIFETLALANGRFNNLFHIFQISIFLFLREGRKGKGFETITYTQVLPLFQVFFFFCHGSHVMSKSFWICSCHGS